MGRITTKPFTKLTKKQQKVRLLAVKRSKQSQMKVRQASKAKECSNDQVYTQFSSKICVQVPEESTSNYSESTLANESFTTSLANYSLHADCVGGSSLNVSQENSDVHTHANYDSDSNVDSLENFKNSLRQCCLDMNINHVQTSALLQVIRSHKCFQHLPKDSRSFLKTRRGSIHFLPLGTGVYWHIGFIKSCHDHLLLYNELPSVLELELSTDGISLSRSNPSQFWPIQYRILNIDNFKPLIAGIYKGEHKPSDVHAFFKCFVDEVQIAQKKGGILVKDRLIPFNFKNFIADAPARALVLNHYGHNSTYPCSKCKIEGVRYENRVMVYLGVNHRKRTDEEYLNNVDDEHQKGNTPLAELSILPVTRVPFDIMHLLYLGVTVRCLEAWFLGKFGFHAKLSSNSIREVSSRYVRLNATCPDNFARRPRSLIKFNKFKATELRHFLNYASPVVLFGVLPEECYFHFLNLHIAIRILTSSTLTTNRLNIARSALQLFVKYAPDLYTAAFVSYNVHALLHLPDDAKTCGPLEKCSAFIYENNMPLFKKNIRNHPRPLQQFARRLQEQNNIQHLKKSRPDNEQVSARHNNGPVPQSIEGMNYAQYKSYKCGKFRFALDNCNCFCKLEDDSICKIINILIIDGKTFMLTRKFKDIEDFYKSPINSSEVGTYVCKNLSQSNHLITMNNITAKCYAMPIWKGSFYENHVSEEIKNEYVVSTLIHYT